MVDNLLKTKNKAKLRSVLTYQFVADKSGRKIGYRCHHQRRGKAEITTVAGGKPTATLQGGKAILTDAKGGKSTVTATDLKASNGVIHVIDPVLMPANQCFFVLE